MKKIKNIQTFLNINKIIEQLIISLYSIFWLSQIVVFIECKFKIKNNKL